MIEDESPSHDGRLTAAIAAYLQAAERGAKPDRQKFLAEHVEIASELESFFDDLSYIKQFGQETESACQTVGQFTAEELLPLVYDELRKLAAVQLANEKPGQTLNATALVHEAYLKLIGKDGAASFASAQQFFVAAAEAMRRILVDQARRKVSIRHGGEWRRVAELRDAPATDGEAERTIIIHEMLDQLAATYSRQAQVVKMRLFLQFTFVEIAGILGLSADTAESDWAFGRAWLKRKWLENSEHSKF